MLIKSIDIQGFKSFADKTTLSFGKGLTAVVGPNGSGKSNVSDAIRWVLGEQSTKSLRGQSMEDVIFSGTETRKAHGFCEVTITFENKDRSLHFDDDAVSVTRRYYRSHESEYLINGTFVRLKDVHELFMDTGLGRDGYSMIGQGKIDTIVSSRSNERRDIFEEASGISRYRYRKIEAERKLNAAEENMLRLKDIETELEQRIGPLKEQSEKAERFIKLSENKRELEIGLWLHTLETSKEAFRSQESKISVATSHYAELEKQIAECEEKMDQNSAEFAEITSKIDEIRGSAAGAEEKIARLQGEINVLNTSKAHNLESIERIKNELTQLSSSDNAAKETTALKQQELTDKEAELKILNTEITELGDKLSKLITDSESISRQIEQKALLLNDLSLQSSNFRVEMVTAESSLAEIAVRLETVSGLLSDKTAEKEKLGAELSLLDEDLKKTEEIITEQENALKGYELRLQSRRQAGEQLKSKLDTQKLDAAEKQRRAQMLEDMERNLEGFSYSVKEVVKEAEKGLLSGIHGPVSRLLGVENSYSVAIEIALGAASQNIVVDTDSDAKKAIALLKNQNKGRATFLPMTSIKSKPFSESGLDDCYGFVGVASQLITFQPKYREIMEWLLGRTVVAEDIDSATTIAKKYGYRFKVVSLDGQVVNPGGSLTGGSLGKSAGMLSRSDDIAKLREQAKMLLEKASETEALFKEALSREAAVNADILAASSAVTTAKEDKIRVLGEIRRVSELLASANTALKELEAEKQAASNRTAELQAVMEKARDNLAELLQQETGLKTEVDDMSGGRASVSDGREELSSKLTELRLSAAKTEKDIESLKSTVEALELSVTDRTVKAEELNAQIADLEDKNNALDESVADLVNLIEQTKNEGSGFLDEVQALTERRTGLEASTAQMRTMEREKTAEKEKISGELARLTERKETMTAELDEIIKRLYDEYELTRSEAEAMDIVIENVTEARKKLAETKNKIRGLGNVNVAAIEEYKEVGERYEFLSAQIKDIEKARTELYKLISELTDQMKTMFLEGFQKIGTYFTKTFSEMFDGGHAELRLTDPDDVLQSGIDIEAKLPGKNVPSLDGLSGGEKALIAISIYFAIMQVNAPPFCFLDEVETALDDINVDRYANYMKHSHLETQFICITHRRGTMEAADMLYGVTMQEKGISKLIELNVKELEKNLKQLEA